ncbi:helix-turn-helix domain-containing protein [Xenorhabdus bovienii]|uniref:HTH cro/C1-type domain-containing protein n=2 Tax=Xenorhabdus bovienii TaxID=40576 RepID=A0A077N9V7_XENBV|nr:helix-turn-helix domain-containing protein [Xenorhabdus bovienii]MDE9437977.1 helix-turn-helix domain-containing protein [Xenorhabdus bovienii]MDE9499336.1 helix-turn-helix domain-containing protein [Xenorhabdus bovienii]MDE9553272.1 helix-turn-helix domain-containing protein [Xenorhabdus bovienii]CDG95794.1 conserved hypothetical protein [Xenorhabdus bovienii str. puntauvense]CDM90220.1 Putative HipB antitoxin (HipAB toxin-antitoxin system) [Xenorhabdus bovienii]
MNELSPSEMIKLLSISGYSQIQIEQATGISQSTISRISSGKHPDPRLSTVRAIEKFYNENVKDKA